MAEEVWTVVFIKYSPDPVKKIWGVSVPVMEKPEVVVFDDKRKMQNHVKEIIRLNFSKFPDVFKKSWNFISALKFEEMMKQFQEMQDEHGRPAGFDLYYDSNPQVVL